MYDRQATCICWDLILTIYAFSSSWWDWLYNSIDDDLNHMCRAFIEQMEMYVRWQADQTRFLPQGDVSDIYDVYASYIYIKLKLFQTQVMGNYTQLISTLTGAFGKFEQDKRNHVIFIFMLSLFKFDKSVSVSMPNNLGYWQDWINEASERNGHCSSYCCILVQIFQIDRIGRVTFLDIPSRVVLY